MTLIARIPAPNPTDSNEVTENLVVATSLWRTGNHEDAIRWVRRAAQAADEAGDAQRMSALALASADLEEALSTEAPADEAPPAPPTLRPGASSQPPPLPARARASLRPPPSSSESRMRAMAPTASLPPKTTPPPLPAKRTLPPTHAAKRTQPPTPSRAAPKSAAPAPLLGKSRFRVSIKTSALDSTLLVVRRLDEGRPVPAGTQEAWIVMGESASADTTRANGKSIR